MALSDAQVKAAKPAEKVYKLSDGGGLQLWVFPDGARRWRLAYRVSGKQKVLALGVYPDVTLKQARDAKQEAKSVHAAGQDPSVKKKLDRITKATADADTFGAIADELIAKKQREARAPTTIQKLDWLISLAKPVIGARPITEISAQELLAVLRPIEARGRHETARRLRAYIGETFRYAIATARAENDPSAALRGALTAPTVKPRSAIIEPVAFGGLLNSVFGYEGAPETVAALKLIVFTFARPGEIRRAEWTEFDLTAAVWEIPAAKMKMRRSHKVPLSTQCLTVLRELHVLTGQGKYLFPSVRSVQRCMSENTINAALRRLGYTKDEMTGHGFRASASSMLNECGLWHADAIERQLAHEDGDTIRRAYARAEFWDERVKMMQWWADKCDELRIHPQALRAQIAT